DPLTAAGPHGGRRAERLRTRPKTRLHGRNAGANRRGWDSYTTMRRLLMLVAAVLVPVVALAAPGDLDSTFNGTGIVVTPVLTSDGIASSVVVQSDGKIVAGGSAFNGFNLDFALVRYDSTGTPDPGFGGGIVT